MHLYLLLHALFPDGPAAWFWGIAFLLVATAFESGVIMVFAGPLQRWRGTRTTVGLAVLVAAAFVGASVVSAIGHPGENDPIATGAFAGAFLGASVSASLTADRSWWRAWGIVTAGCVGGLVGGWVIAALIRYTFHV